MPLFQVDIEKTNGSIFWSNRYICEAATIQDAQIAGLGYVNRERAITSKQILFSVYRVRDMIEDNDQFIITPIQGPGDRNIETPFLPLFNVVRVDFGVGIGRPSRKYLRLPVYEADQENGYLIASVVSNINLDYVVPMVADPTFVDVDGQPIISGQVSQQVGMRQLRRGSKRKTQPIIG